MNQMSIFDFPEYIPDGMKKETKFEECMNLPICAKREECDAYPVGCGGTIEPCRFGGAYKW